MILVDTREQRILPIEGYALETATLPVGDYGIDGFSDWNNPAFIVERKSLDDLIASLTTNRERFMRECEGLRRFRFAALVIEGTEDQIARRKYRSLARPNSILQSLAALQVRNGIHVIFAGDHDGAARTVERLIRQFARGIEKDHARLAKCKAYTERERTAS